MKLVKEKWANQNLPLPWILISCSISQSEILGQYDIFVEATRVCKSQFLSHGVFSNSSHSRLLQTYGKEISENVRKQMRSRWFLFLLWLQCGNQLKFCSFIVVFLKTTTIVIWHVIHRKFRWLLLLHGRLNVNSFRNKWFLGRSEQNSFNYFLLV